jgi:hypothetical protein
VASLLMSLAEAQASQSLQREASDAAVNNIGAQTAQLLDFAQRPKKKDVRIVTDGSGMPIGAEVTEIPT